MPMLISSCCDAMCKHQKIAGYTGNQDKAYIKYSYRKKTVMQASDNVVGCVFCL